MAGLTFLRLSSGQLIEVKGTQTSAGAGDAGKIVALDSGGKLDSTLLPTGVGAETETIVASEGLSAGDLVNIYNNSGTRTCRKADASNGRRAHGFVLAVVESAANATVYTAGTNNGLTIAVTNAGLPVYLSTSGAVSTTAASTPGHLSQEVGICVGANKVAFTPHRPVTLA